jgi:pentatricopeptide repeat protein
MTKNAFTLPTNVVTNSVLEACVNTKSYEKALKVAEEMDEIRTGMWLKGKYRADSVTFSLALKAGIEGCRLWFTLIFGFSIDPDIDITVGKLFDRMPKILMIMGNDGLFVTPTTARKLLSKAIENNQLSAAKNILTILDSQKIKVEDDVRLLVEGRDQQAKKISH